MKYLSLLLSSAFAIAYATNCDVCKTTVNAMNELYKTENPNDDAAFLNALLNQCDKFTVDDEKQYCRNFSNCQHRKIRLDICAQSCSVERTCIDIGGCDGPLSSSQDMPLVDWTNRTHDFQSSRCVPVTLLVLHHTVTHSAQETLEILNHRELSVQYIAEKNGTIFQMVHDYYRAWHAGVSHWRNYSDLNSWAVGVEIVNTGDEPFPDAQLEGVINLSRMLINRWHIDQHNIIGHFDIKPIGKEDPSGYFNWKKYYTELGFYEEIWASSLSADKQKEVLMNKDQYDSTKLLRVQEGLRGFGYEGNLNATGEYDESTRFVMQAFNRHWCPEIFKIEKVDYSTNLTIDDPENQQWYALSQERLDKLFPIDDASCALKPSLLVLLLSFIIKICFTPDCVFA